MESRRISLDTLSARQRRVVERNLPLVHLTLNRHAGLCRHRRAGRERVELFQEGCLALMDAVRNHDASRHGVFAAFAMARIHFAVSRFVHEHESNIRIPYITQRRRKKQRDNATSDRHRPDALPRVVNEPDGGGASRGGRPRDRRRPDAQPGGVTIGDKIRDCFDRASGAVVREMEDAPRCGPGHRDVVRRCAQERWNIPEPDARMPIRRLAEALACSVGRITHCEDRFKKKVAVTLENDAAYRELRRLAKMNPEGMRGRIDAHETPAEA